MKFKEFISVLGDYDGGINRGVKVDMSFLDKIKAEFSEEVDCDDVEKLRGFEQICGKIVQKNDLPVSLLKLKARKALFLELSEDVEKVDVDMGDVGYLCIKVCPGVSGVINLVGGRLNSCFVEGILEEGSELEMNIDVCESESVFVSRLKIMESAHLNMNVGDLNVENGYFDIKNFLEGRLACANVNWIYLSGGRGLKNAYVANYFQNKNCNGEILVKGVQEEKSKVTFLGEINISLNGGGTDSYLKEDVMVLDESSYVEAIPSLEIKTNDVKAGHGVSISKITDDKMFYLKSRGLNEDVARNLLRQGFLKSGYEKFGNISLVEKMDKIVMQ